MSINEWLLFFLSYNLLVFVGSQRLFKLAGVDNWKSLIPVYNILKYLEIIRRPKWWAILVFIPIINLLMISVIWVEFIKRFNHNLSLIHI